jgi:2,4-dienoyl-CoA reductase-like NADH-dependent reductase (Old Yellow Enzyme family)
MSLLFEPLELRGVRLRNRIGIAPMCQYSATDGIPDDWHLVHLASRAVGGAGLVMTEATAVTPQGRISPGCTGIYDDHQATAWARIAAAVAAQGAVPGIQLAHAGRKASTAAPWETGETWLTPGDGGWQVVGPSPLPFDDGAHVPHELDESEIAGIVIAFADAARRAVDAGFELVEVHAAHGYLLHSFLTPLANERTDRYGGDRDGRMRLACEVTAAVRDAVGEQVPVLVRISASDWAPGGWSIEDSVALAERLREVGADMIDCSSGGAVPHATIEVGPGYQVPFAAQIRAEANIPTAAVGMITTPEQAEDVLVDGAADLVLIGRESLRDPYWPLYAAAELDAMDVVEVPLQYARGLSRRRGGAPLD